MRTLATAALSLAASLAAVPAGLFTGLPIALGAPRDVTADFEVDPALEVKVWAETPLFHNPTNIDVDARGRIWLTEAVNYRIKIRKSTPGDGYLRHAKGDRVVVLDDTDGDGVADKSTVFVEDPELISPLGIAVFGNRVVVSSSPSVFVYTDTDGDDRADKKEVFLTGFGGVDHDHGVHAFTVGPDGAWYFNTGNVGPHVVKDHDGKTVRTKSPSDDGRLYVEGLVLRVDPSGRGLRVLADNFRNSFELSLDAFGNLWQTDNDDDGNESCRVTHILEGGSYGYASLDGRRSWRADRRAGQATTTAHWHQEDPGTIPPSLVTGSGAPTGSVIYEGALLPARVRGALLAADAGRSTVYLDRPVPRGAGFDIDRAPFLATKASGGDEARRFRPSDVAVGLDGSLYVADWYDPIVGGHGMKDKTGVGRILRVAPRGAAARAPRADTTTVDGALAALLSPAVNVRWLGFQALRAQGAAALPAIAARLSGADVHTRARLLWFLAGAGPDGRAHVVKALRDRDANLRLTAFRALRQQDPAAVDLARLARDPSPALRREVALSLRDVPVEKSGPVLLALASTYRTGDRTMLEALGIGFAGKEEALYPTLLKRLGGRDPLRWSPALVDLVWRLHPSASVPALRARAEARSLSDADRRRAIVALAFVPTQAAADAVLAAIEKQPEPLRSFALDLAFDRSTGEWKDFGVAARLEQYKTPVVDAKARAALEALRAELHGEHATPEQRAKAVERLSATKEGGLYLIGLAGQGKLPEPLKPVAAEAIFRNPDVGVRALASQYFTRPAFDGASYPPVSALMKMKGDASRGEKVFFSDTAACAKCHEYAGKGAHIGPPLTEIAKKLGRDALFDSVLNPSAAIAFGYEPWVVTTKDQQTFTGFVIGDGETLSLREISGETRLIKKSDVAHRRQEKASIMPDNIALGMKPQELVDLIEFLAVPRK